MNKKKIDDIENVMERAFANHLDKIIITGTTLEDSKQVLEFSKKIGILSE